MSAYVVVENTPGYLPESEPVEFDNRADAIEYAKELLDELVAEIEEEGGQAVRTTEIAGSLWSVVRTFTDGTAEARDLGRVVEIIEEGQSS